MDKRCFDPTFLWCVTYFSSCFAQGRTVDELSFWSAVFTLVGDQLALLATEFPNASGAGGTSDTSAASDTSNVSNTDNAAMGVDPSTASGTVGTVSASAVYGKK